MEKTLVLHTGITLTRGDPKAHTAMAAGRNVPGLSQEFKLFPIPSANMLPLPQTIMQMLMDPWSLLTLRCLMTIKCHR